MLQTVFNWNCLLQAITVVTAKTNEENIICYKKQNQNKAKHTEYILNKRLLNKDIDQNYMCTTQLTKRKISNKNRFLVIVLKY